MSKQTKPKLTLERLADLDAAASPGPWEVYNPSRWVRTVCDLDGCFVVEGCGQPGRQSANTKFLAAARGAPTRLLAALRALADRWEIERPNAMFTSAAQKSCADELRTLIRDLDLSAQGEADHA